MVISDKLDTCGLISMSSFPVTGELELEGGGVGAMEGLMFHFPNLYPLVPPASSLNCFHALVLYLFQMF